MSEILESMYGQRMMNYYPVVINQIQEFKAIIESEYPEFEQLSESKDTVLNDSTFSRMGEERVKQWEKALGIKPIESSSLSDRRETIIARIRGQGKLNTAIINSIVNAFTGGTANSWIEDSTLYVAITPPPNNKVFQFNNVEQELNKKIPAHLGLIIFRNYATWGELTTNHADWNTIKNNYSTWGDVKQYVAP